ncbi:MAG TPA: hypothetical protein PLF11_08645 [Bacillota bacterium]|jgi:hypothetical protein|nr:MAG: hypothetical protein BWX48_00078 [Verrucomicrobia bacterium ADurb.Bin006]HOI37436.1 hypothetical protein [Bacillota bacterium]HUM36373.1 hypothetical protein [Anaerolineae bacterium]
MGALCVLGWLTAAHGAGLCVTGRLECCFFRQTGEVLAKQVSPFEIELFEGGWRVREYQGLSYFDRTCDGTNVYCCFWDGGTRAPARAAHIVPGVVPDGSYPVALPWLAYASGAFLRTNASVPAPWLPPQLSPGAHIYSAQAQFLKDAPFLPESVRFVVTKERLAEAMGSPWLSIEGVNRRDLTERRRWSTEETAGFVGGEYRVLSLTNACGFTVPTAFEFTKHRAMPSRVAAQASRDRSTAVQTNIYPYALVCRGVAAGFALVEHGPELPDLGSREVWITDARFRNEERRIGSIVYAVTNNWIRDIRDPLLQARFRQKVDSVPRLRWEDYKMWVLYFAFAVVVLAPVWYSLISRRLNRDRGRALGSEE